MSCNGCRVLRKGCSENCSIRPCLLWIKNPDSQANATVFLAKFYGRAGLMNLINAGPESLRPAIFRSLLYEACGRIVNPIYGSVGLLWSGSWQMCQTAVEAVLKGTPIVQISSETAADTPSPPLKTYDIRHVFKEENISSAPGSAGASSGSDLLHKVANKSTRTRFKRPGNGNVKLKLSRPAGSAAGSEVEPIDADVESRWRLSCPVDCQRTPTSHESSGSHDSSAPVTACRENESGFSEETAENASMLTAEQEKHDSCECDVELDLKLGLEPMSQHSRSNSMNGAPPPPPPKRCEKPIDGCDSSADLCRVDLALDLTA